MFEEFVAYSLDVANGRQVIVHPIFFRHFRRVDNLAGFVFGFEGHHSVDDLLRRDQILLHRLKEASNEHGRRRVGFFFHCSKEFLRFVDPLFLHHVPDFGGKVGEYTDCALVFPIGHRGYFRNAFVADAPAEAVFENGPVVGRQIFIGFPGMVGYIVLRLCNPSQFA